MGYFDKLDKKNNLILYTVSIIVFFGFIIIDFIEKKVTIVTLIYFICILGTVFYIIKEIKKK